MNWLSIVFFIRVCVCVCACAGGCMYVQLFVVMPNFSCYNFLCSNCVSPACSWTNMMMMMTKKLCWWGVRAFLLLLYQVVSSQESKEIAISFQHRSCGYNAPICTGGDRRSPASVDRDLVVYVDGVRAGSPRRREREREFCGHGLTRRRFWIDSQTKQGRLLLLTVALRRKLIAWCDCYRPLYGRGALVCGDSTVCM